MNYESVNGFSLLNLARKNIILGKNGCGKSHLLKQFEQGIRLRDHVGKVRYISPERGGDLVYEPGIDQAISNNPGWMDDSRRNNQSGNFRQQSVTLYRRLELLALREIEREHTLPDYIPKTFQDTVDKINSLLDRVKLERSDNGFKFALLAGGAEAGASTLSSGEAELVSLAIELLSFRKECDPEKANFLLIDEPDVHLHPDLQDKLAVFMSDQISTPFLTIILASHSTSFVGALARGGKANVAFMKRGDTSLNFSSISETQKKILPMFGAHPLSNVFNDAPILIVEGEDDERIWQQAVKSSFGRISLYPCVAGSIDQMNAFEVQANNVMQAVYDNAIGYSIRDRDESTEEIADVGSVRRMKLSCRAAENLMLSDDALALAGTDWDKLNALISKFVAESTSHPFHAAMKTFVDGGMDRKNGKLKQIRMVLAGFITNKPWEVLVGQTIAKMATEGNSNGEHSLRCYLGEKACRELLGIQEPKVEEKITYQAKEDPVKPADTVPHMEPDIFEQDEIS